MGIVFSCKLLLNFVIEIFEVHLLTVYQVADLDFQHLQKNFILALRGTKLIIRPFSKRPVTCLRIQLFVVVQVN